MKKISVLKDQAVTALEGNWLKAALVMLIYIVLIDAAPFTAGFYVGFTGGAYYYIYPSYLVVYLLLPMVYGYNLTFLNVKRGTKIKVGTLFEGFKEYGRIWCTLMLNLIYVWIGTMLCFIPGIYVAYATALTPFILKDYPQMKYHRAIMMSWKMMKGHKWKLFVLDLSFLGWVLLCILTLGIGFLFLSPYWYTTRAAFYDNLKEELGAPSKEAATEVATAE
ncbi:MAG: DUF975 family protein [Prevotellaceae bacterium]|jgi:uncharacterized membrane protein|nr:DUF975 family protein [Prevotellaceae bacterium]